MTLKHPHTCGEHLCIDVMHIYRYGSFPIRGTHRWKQTLTVARIIPNMWGTQLIFIFLSSVWQRDIPNMWETFAWRPFVPHSARDHPLTIGELIDTALFPAMSSGSSPSIWGNTDLLTIATVLVWDHPHTCGEHNYFNNCKNYLNGISPHTWEHFTQS